MSSSPLESEDLDNVPLVRMEDVQPSRERNYELIRVGDDTEEVETCVIEGIEYDNECIIKNDDDSNIGSMVSVRTEEEVEEEGEMIVPEIINEPRREYNYIQNPRTPTSWPTLEILPGGVIKKPDKLNDDPITDEDDKSDMMYACAKCPQKFKFLFCLVKHVKWHEDEEKQKANPMPIQKPKEVYKKFACTHSRTNKTKVLICMKTHKKKTPKKTKS